MYEYVVYPEGTQEPKRKGRLMRWGCLWSAMILPLLIIVGVLALGPLIIKWLWVWTVPDILPGAVEKGLVAGTITWWTAFKLAVFVAFIAAVTGLRPHRRESA